MLHAVKDEANCFESKISFPGFANSMFPLNWPVRPRKIWTSSAKPTPEIAASLIDASAIKRTEATNVSPRYHPPSLRPFRKALSKEFRGK